MKAVAAAVLLLGVAGTGCVQYVPLELSSVQPAEEVRVHVTDPAAVRLAQHLGRITSEVTATVQPAPADSVAVTVWLGRDYPGTQFENVRQTIVLDRQEITSLQRRSISVWRSAAAGLAVAAVFAVLVDRLGLLEDPNSPDDDGTGTPPPALLIPVGFTPQ